MPFVEKIIGRAKIDWLGDYSRKIAVFIGIILQQDDHNYVLGVSLPVSRHIKKTKLIFPLNFLQD